MSLYPYRPLDFAGLATVPLKARGGKVRVDQFARPHTKGAGFVEWLDSLPRILAGDSLRGVVEALLRARREKRAIVWGLGGHVI
ncbi:MAG: hypothetical protein ABI165_03740, partial [Bryobacteraceae bacterium]